MKKTLLISLIFSFSCFTPLFSQEIDFEILFDTEGDEELGDFILDHEQNFIGVVLKAPPPDSTTYYIYETYLYRVTQQGDTISTKFTKEDTIYIYDRVCSLKNDPGGILLIGWGVKKGESTYFDRFTSIVKLNNNLEVEWEKIYKFDYMYNVLTAEIMELENGDFLYACSPAGVTEMFLMRLSPDGDILNFREYAGDSAGMVIDLSYNYDSTDILLSTLGLDSMPMGSFSTAVHIDENLEQTQVDYYPEGFENPYNAIAYPGNRWLAGGSYYWHKIPGFILERQICAYLLDSSFNVQHEIRLTDPDTNSRGAEITSIDYYDPSCIYLGGNHNLQNIQGYEPSWFYVARLNDTLGLEYEKYVGGDDYYWLYSVNAAPDGGVMVAGTRTDYTDPVFQRDAYLIKFDSTGFPVSVPEESDIRITDAILYPNPGGGYLKVRTALKNCRLNLHDINGREVLSAPLTDHITSVSTASLPEGSYPYKVVQDKKEIISGVWIKKVK